MFSIKILISLGIIGNTVRAKNENPENINGRYQIKLDIPKTIGDETIKPRIAFLESVKNTKAINNEEIINKVIFLVRDLLGAYSSDKQKGQTSTIHNPA